MVVRGMQRALHILRFRIGGLIRIHPQDALYAAEYTADRAAYHGADRAGASVAFIYAMRNTARYSLRVRSERNRERGEKNACNQNLSLH